jgi:putative nucleotidyltransferase with HDIG domain
MRYATGIAKAMRCANEQLKTVARGALLHDIGKIAIPDAILTKSGPLTTAERALMETHVRHGYDILRGIAFLEGAAEIVLTHHERFDGTGYPQGLLAEAIPIGARIFSVADTLDAMTSDRPYRRAMTLAVARKEISDQSGAQFDPEVVSAFFSIDEVALGFQKMVANCITDQIAHGSQAELVNDPRPVELDCSDTGPADRSDLLV